MNEFSIELLSGLTNTLGGAPHAKAEIHGNSAYPSVCGEVQFYQTGCGIIVAAELRGLPSPTGRCCSPVFGFHIHSGCSCSGNSRDPFADAGTHYDPNSCAHPYHAGDMPPLFGANGRALSVFLTDRFCVNEVIGRTVIIHADADDFTTQPAGNAGVKIACGEIRATGGARRNCC